VGLEAEASYPWLVEAPLHAVEVYEAILRLTHVRNAPLKVWACQAGVMRMFNLDKNGKWKKPDSIHLANYTEREVSFVLLSSDESSTVDRWFSAHGYLHWFAGHLLTPFGKPKIILCRSETSHEEFLESVNGTLAKLGLQDCCFSRSLLPKGINALPISIVDLAKGRAGPNWSYIRAEVVDGLDDYHSGWVDWVGLPSDSQNTLTFPIRMISS
jgi:hypothetical protein